MIVRVQSTGKPDETLAREQIDDALTSIEENLPHVANPNLLPEEVVERQITALQASNATPDELKICYALAAPSNRQVTGPYENFAAMVSQSPYDRLITATTWQMGSTTIEGDFAATLVTTMNPDGAPAAFRFVMEKQAEEPYSNCWMTIAVQYVELASLNSLTSSPL